MCQGKGVSVGHFEILKKMVWHSRHIIDVLAGRKSDRMGFIFWREKSDNFRIVLLTHLALDADTAAFRGAQFSQMAQISKLGSFLMQKIGALCDGFLRGYLVLQAQWVDSPTDAISEKLSWRLGFEAFG